jgi:hypothetical protein
MPSIIVQHMIDSPYTIRNDRLLFGLSRFRSSHVSVSTRDFAATLSAALHDTFALQQLNCSPAAKL